MKNKERVWTTERGDEIPITEMGNRHLVNAYKMLQRKGFITPDTLDFYMCTSGPQGEMAQMAFQQELDMILKAPVCKEMSYLEEELERRGIETTPC